MSKIFRYIITLVLALCVQHAYSLGFGRRDSLDIPKNKFPFSNGSTMVSYAFSSGALQTHELRIEHFVHPQWSLLYTSAYSVRSNFGFAGPEGNYSEFRAPLGLSVGVGMVGVSTGSYACGWNDGEALWSLVRLSCMIPDGIAFHIPLAATFDLSPYLNFSGLVFHWDEANNTRLYYSPMGGIRLLYPAGPNFVFSVEQNVRRTMNGNFSAAVGGSISLSF